MEFVSTDENFVSDFVNDDISADFPPLKPVAASERLRMPVEMLESLCVSTFKELENF